MCLITAVLGGALAFLLGLLGGQPDGNGVWLWLLGSLAATGAVVVVEVRLVLGTQAKATDVGVLFVPLLGALLGGLLLAGFAAAFVAGIYVCFEEGWGDRGIQGDLGGIDETWESWLSEFLRPFVLGSGIVGGFLGFLAWASRFVRIAGGSR